MFIKYELEPAHAEQVKKLSLVFFDKTQGLVHNMGEYERELLEAGALLHDIGYYISAKSHHKNAYKLIKENPPEGFTDTETEIIANIARYHRSKIPQKKHKPYMGLSKNDRHLLSRLAAFVRVADALDRTHCSVVEDMDFDLKENEKVLCIKLKLCTPSCYSEIIKANEKKDLFEKEFGLELRIGI